MKLRVLCNFCREKLFRSRTSGYRSYFRFAGKSLFGPFWLSLEVYFENSKVQIRYTHSIEIFSSLEVNNRASFSKFAKWSTLAKTLLGLDENGDPVDENAKYVILLIIWAVELISQLFTCVLSGQCSLVNRVYLAYKLLNTWKSYSYLSIRMLLLWLSKFDPGWSQGQGLQLFLVQTWFIESLSQWYSIDACKQFKPHY